MKWNKVRFVSISKEVSFFLSLAFLLLASSGFLGKQGLFLGFFSIFLTFYLLLDGVKRPNFCFFMLFLFGLSYNLFTFLDKTWSVSHLFYFIFLPLLGYQFAFQEEKKGSKRLVFVLFLAAIGMFFSAFKVITVTFLLNGLHLGEGQPLFCSLSGKVMSRTGLSLYLMPAVGLAVAFLSSIRGLEKNHLFWMGVVLSLFVITFSVICSSLVGNRAFVVAFLILAIFGILNECFHTKNDALKIITSSVCFAFLLAVFLLIMGFVPDFLKSITVFERFLTGGSNSNRLEIYKSFFTHFYLYPFGGFHQIVDEYYVHNFLLDIYNFGGIFPFVIFCYLFFVSLIPFVKGNASGMYLPGRRYSFYAMLSLFSIGLFEPIFQANSLTLLFFALFIGIGCYLKKPLGNGRCKISI